MPIRSVSDGARYDLVLVGAGLANSLIGLFLAYARRELSVLLVERDDRVGGNHTWSFHTTDVSSREYEVLNPLIAARWPAQEVHFPNLRRRLETGYNSITSDRVHDAVLANSSLDVALGENVGSVHGDRVELADGRTLYGSCIIDGRGARGSDALTLGYQKFVGIELELDAPHGRELPIIMDATVEQIDGYRFVYTLPFSPTTILVEDTYYSDTAALDVDALAERTLAYVAGRGWKIKNELRREHGILPITLSGDIKRFWQEGEPGAARSGMRACLFHPTTGYSLPDAVKLASRVAKAPSINTAAIDRLIRAHSHACWNERGFFRMLNRMLFVAAKDHERRAILERFYTIPAASIERFYAGELTAGDKMRILMGRPPLPISRALTAIPEKHSKTNARRPKASSVPGA